MFTSLAVSSVKGQCKDRTSALRIALSKAILPGRICFACGRSATMTFIPKAAAIFATFNPIFPRPIIPSVFPLSSSLLKELLEAHCPFLTADKASNRFRCMVNIREMVCSATVEAFEPGALKNNLVALLDALTKAKPAASTGIYLRKVAVSSTMGAGVRVDQNSLAA